MADPTRQAIDRMGELRREPASESVLAEVRKTLANKSNWAVAAAAEVAKNFAETPMGEGLIKDLEKAFVRFIEKNPETADRGCKAKTTIVEALRALDAPSTAVYMRGVRHVQREPVFGGSEDTAAALRGECAMGLVDCRYPEALHECIRLLADPERPARIGAVKALGASGRPEAALLLRLEIVKGDPEPEVISEAMTELMALDTRGSFDFIASCLDRDGDDEEYLAEAAALALGSSRDERAFELLREKFARTSNATLRDSIMVAIATLRVEGTHEFLAKQVAEGNRAAARGALEALALYRGDERVQQAVKDALARRADADLTAEASRLGFR